MKNSQGDSVGDVDKIFCLILYDFKDFDNFPEIVRGTHPPHPPPCDDLGKGYNKGYLQILYAKKKEVPNQEEEDSQGSNAVCDGSKPRDVDKDCDTSSNKRFKSSTSTGQ